MYKKHDTKKKIKGNYEPYQGKYNFPCQISRQGNNYKRVDRLMLCRAVN